MSNNPWNDLAAPLPPSAIEWRIDGKPLDRDGKKIARFVPYTTAQYARERFDSIVPGEWSCTLEMLPTVAELSRDGVTENLYVFKARVQVLGVVREDVGEGSSPKGAATDAFKRACMRFGLAHELYSTDNLWIEVDGGRYPKPLEDPATVYARKIGAPAPAPAPVTYREPRPPVSTSVNGAPHDYYPEQWSGSAPAPAAAPAEAIPTCPICSGKLWDNRVGKRNPKAPDFKCRDRRCDGVVWDFAKWLATQQPAAALSPAGSKGPQDEEDDDLPF